MAVLTWDQVGERIYQAGVDRGVLYLQDGTAVVWNGLVGLEESPQTELKSFWLDGVKYLDNLTPADFSAKLKAYTYPDEFDAVNGIAEPAPGLFFHEQPPKSFNLSYRTRLGNDVKGTDLGYRIHILYNLIAVPDSMSYDSLQDSNVSPVEFAWQLVGTPPPLEKFRPTVHVSMDSTKTPPDIWQILIDRLWGTDISDPSLPSIIEIGKIFGYLGALIITDNGDGTWSATDAANEYITMLNPTTFQIDNADATYLDAVTYTISSTNYD